MRRFRSGCADEALPQQPDGIPDGHSGCIGGSTHLILLQKAFALINSGFAHRLPLLHRGFQLLRQGQLGVEGGGRPLLHQHRPGQGRVIQRDAARRASLDRDLERLNLEREKMKSDRFLQSMSRIVDRYMVVNLDTGRYRYHELRSSEPLYPTSGQYSEMVEIISKRYVALTETENAKLSRLLTPDYLRSVLRKPDDNLKIEYCSRTENAYMVLTVIPVEWHADGTVAVVMEVVQDIGQKVELENMANTDSLTGLFNERYFSRVLNICEAKKLPFVLYYLDLDRFKPVNDTYGHAMGDRLLKEISARLLRCIRSRDYAFRIGGDEFALIVSADMDEEQRSRMAERIQAMLSAPIVIEEKVLSVGVSCGCACYPEDGDASQVRIKADSRMYAEKQHHHEDDRPEEQS